MINKKPKTYYNLTEKYSDEWENQKLIENAEKRFDGLIVECLQLEGKENRLKMKKSFPSSHPISWIDGLSGKGIKINNNKIFFPEKFRYILKPYLSITKKRHKIKERENGFIIIKAGSLTKSGGLWDCTRGWVPPFIYKYRKNNFQDGDFLTFVEIIEKTHFVYHNKESD